MLRQRMLCVTGALLAAASSAASAQIAFTAGPMDVYAGPAGGYPLVARLAPGAPVRVMGCLNDWSWCDIAFAGNRGWAYAPGISYMYLGARVPLYAYAPRLGIPVVVFSIGPYWDRYYRGRPWYSQRDVWLRRPPPPHMRPPGPPPMWHAAPARPPLRLGSAAGPYRPDWGPGNRPGPGGSRPGRPGARPPDAGSGKPGAARAQPGRGSDRPAARPDPGRPGPPAQPPDQSSQALLPPRGSF
jgi:uncharacterized protein YraI